MEDDGGERTLLCAITWRRKLPAVTAACFRRAAVVAGRARGGKDAAQARNGRASAARVEAMRLLHVEQLRSI